MLLAEFPADDKTSKRCSGAGDCAAQHPTLQNNDRQSSRGFSMSVLPSNFSILKSVSVPMSVSVSTSTSVSMPHIDIDVDVNSKRQDGD